MKRSSRRSAVLLAIVGTLALGTMAVAPTTTAAEDLNATRKVVVDTDHVVQKDYLGVGVNVIPWSLMDNTATYGYDAADWEVDVERILTMRPKVARVWFQIDWMELEKGVYDFDSPEMRAFDQYMRAFQQAGTEVELNFGWKVGKRVHDWFAIEGAPDPYISAPADLEAYGRSASALLNELIVERGYSNIQYLTFYNEPNGSWDFWAPGDEKAYYADMARAVHDQLRADGLRDRVEIWGPEEVNASDWTRYMAKNANDVFDGYSFHLYGESYDFMAEAIADRQSVVGGEPVHLTEMGWTNPGTSVWETGYANYLIRSANAGVKSNLVWQLNGVMTDDPAGDTNGAFNLWDSVILGPEPTAAFYEAGLLMRYIPAHSEVLGTRVSDDDVRAAAYRDRHGDITVLVETREGRPKDVTVEFRGARGNEKFHRFAFTDDVAQPEPNALLPASSGTLMTHKNQFTDTVSGDHGYAIYTTADPATQVAVKPMQTTVTGGETVQLSSRLLDSASPSERVEWSVVGADNGTVDASGRYTAPDVTSERTVAVRATSSLNPQTYGVAQVTVLPASREGVTDVPSFSLEPGVYESTEAVFITSATEGAEIYYTTDGSKPTTSSKRYTGPVFLPTLQNTYLRAIAVADGLEQSSVTSRLYKVLGKQVAPDGYTFCMYADRGTCEFEGDAHVAFGSEGSFHFGTFTDGVACTAANFGGNPNPGGDNRCFFNPDTTSEPPLVTIINAGFESPETSGTANGPMVNGWKFSARSGVQHNNSVFNPAFPAPEGERTAYLKTDSGLGSRIEQTVKFSAGTYRLRFAAANRTDFGGLQRFDVAIDGAVVASVAPQDGEYVYHTSDPFTVQSGEVTISFIARTVDGDNTAFIDDVRVVAAE